MKTYEQLTIADHFMFGKICQDPKNSQLILRALLSEDINVQSTDIEKQITQYDDRKFVRLDLLARDDNGTVYNGELQNEPKNPQRNVELPKRARYYQGILDTSILSRGEPYKNLPELYIIFICTYDPFGKGLYKYTFDEKCNEIELPEFNTHCHKIFFNTSADLNNAPNNLRNMLQYFQTGNVSDNATSSLEDAIIDARLKNEWREEYMLAYIHDNDVYEDGYDSGYDSGKLDILISLVDDKTLSIKEAAKRAHMTEEDFSKLIK